jgi:homocysteine S-methyltransferase
MISVLAILFNCSEPEAITLALQKIHEDKELLVLMKYSNILLGAYANRLTQVDPNWTLADSETAQPFRNDLDENHYWNDFAKKWIDVYAVQLIGGCCGITPEHIAFIKREIEQRKKK